MKNEKKTQQEQQIEQETRQTAQNYESTAIHQLLLFCDNFNNFM